MISIIEHTALEFLKPSTSSLKGKITFGGIVCMISTGYFIQFQLIGSFGLFILCTMPWMWRPLCQLVTGLFCPGWSPDVSVTPECLSACPPPHPIQSKSLGFLHVQTMPTSYKPVCMTLYCIRFLCQSSHPILRNPWRYWLSVVVVS